MNDLPRKDLSTPRLVMILSFTISLVSAVILFRLASGAGDAPLEMDAMYLILICALLLGVLAFYVSLSTLARRLGRRPMVWVGLVFVTSPFGAFVAFPWMLSIVSKAQKEAATRPE